MSPLFGRRDHEHQDVMAVAARDLSSGQPQTESAAGSLLDAEVARLSGLPLPDLAAEVMNNAMRLTAEPGASPLELFNVARVLVQPEIRDAAESDPRMRDLVGEAIQVLEQARLVRLDAWFQGQSNHVGYTTTRLGRAALEQNAVERVLSGGSL